MVAIKNVGILNLRLSPLMIGVWLVVAPLTNPVAAAEIDYILSICSGCHGLAGISQKKLTPNLAGQRAKYIQKQLQDFRVSARRGNSKGEQLTDIGGRRRHPIMSTMAARLSDEQIEALSTYYDDLPCRIPDKLENAPSTPKVSTCLACHGENGIPHKPWVPRISSQNKIYLINQIYILQIAAAGRQSVVPSPRSHPIMEEKVKGLSPKDVEAIATYFSARSCR